MIPRWLLGCLTVLLLVGLATGAKAQFYGGPGIVAYGQNYGVPYPQALPGYSDYSGYYGYSGDYGYPGDYGYYGDMYAPQYWGPTSSPYGYFGPGAYGYGYRPPMYAYPPYSVSPAVPYRPYMGRPYRVGPYIAMSLRQYLAKGFQGPTRVRDIVPGVPGLDG